MHGSDMGSFGICGAGNTFQSADGVVAVVFAVFVVFAACVIAGIASVAAGFFAFGKSLADGLLVLGGGLFMLGAGILAFFLGTYIVKGIVSAFKMIFKKN